MPNYTTSLLAPLPAPCLDLEEVEEGTLLEQHTDRGVIRVAIVTDEHNLVFIASTKAGDPEIGVQYPVSEYNLNKGDHWALLSRPLTITPTTPEA